MKTKLFSIFAILFVLLVMKPQSAEARIDFSDLVNITIINETKHTICKIYLTPSPSLVWTNEVLRGSQMKPWAARVFPVSKDFYNVRVDNCAGQTIIMRYVVDMQSSRAFTIIDELNPPAPQGDGNNGGCVIPDSGPWPPCATGDNGGSASPTPTQPPAQQQKVAFTIQNRSSIKICGVFLTKTSVLGGNWLGNWPINPGRQRTLQVPSGYYDLYVKNCDGLTVYREFGLNLTRPYVLPLVNR